MKNKKLWLGILVIVFVCLGCTSVAGNVESAVSFYKPIPIDNIMIGSFTYNINDSYIVRPDGWLIPEPSLTERRTHEAYYEVEKIDNNGNTVIERLMKDDYHMASYNELYSWALRCAAETAGITQIVAVKSFLTTTTTYTGVANVAR